MKFIETGLAGAFLIETTPHVDHRGTFERAWCRRAFEAQGIDADFVQANRSINPYPGTLRGMHFQVAPHAEAKLVTCIRGQIFDAMVDLRPDSPTYCQWYGEKLAADEGRSIYIPKGFAHGFQTLTPDTELYYQVTEYYVPDAERGIRFDDPAIGISWPRPIAVISDKDRAWPPLCPESRDRRR